MSRSGGISFTSDTLTPGIEAFAPKLHSAVSAVVELYADRSTAFMKSNAPWTDRTSNARSGLNARAFTSGDEYAIILYHTMPYGIWLEVRWSGRYAIILPTVETMGPQLMSALRKLMARM